MKLAIVPVCAAVLLAAAGCSRGPNDTVIVRNIQAQVQKDAAAGGTINIASLDGVVTLTGNVTSDAARALAEREAADTAGVKKVVNNLTVSPAAPPAAAAAAAPPPAQVPAEPAPTPAHRQARPHHTRAAKAPAPAEETHTASAAPPPVNPPAPVPAPAPAAPAPAPAVQSAPAPPPPPAKATIASGTVLTIRLVDALDSSRNQVGDTFKATLNAPIRENGEVVVPAGSDVEGRVAEVTNAGRLTGRSEMRLELTKLTVHGQAYPLHTQAFDRADNARGKGTAETVGGGAALGAIIGAIAGGGKGAAIGGLAGAGAGGVARAAKRGQPVHFPSETVLSFTLQSPVTVKLR